MMTTEMVREVSVIFVQLIRLMAKEDSINVELKMFQECNRIISGLQTIYICASRYVNTYHRKFWGKARPELKAGNLTVICEPID
jgi:hypothetical protein